ncbi:LPS export ABC transporter periplasmic protein LptC [Crenobacter cavernae]|uniref:LPS export ABC transporter periplasmic protein LptC n=1 Tax=Crenobacter cavernae TaxID=2290923 RepID=A0A345Y2T4_9NEIS|nr:LPS export ABC transporter periplasmic protein LptC [Crenobacter cavernae]AXK38236.1 LPS export ABC transporter periplasmic protein LptC [Crenobacter cavernae]
MIRPHRLFPIALVGLMAMLAFWLDQISRWSPSGKELDPSRPEYTVEDFSATRFDAQGRIQERLVAKQGWQFPKQPDLHLREAVLDNYQAGALAYRAAGAIARYNRQDGIAFLEQKAHFFKPGVAGQPDTHVYGSRITINTRTRVASAKTPVEIHYGESIANAIGFEYQQQKGLLRLLSHARVKYVQ